jgi:hypothetical protein
MRCSHPRRVPPSRRLNVLSDGLSLAGFQVIMYGRFWVITEVQLQQIERIKQNGPRRRINS